MSENHGFVSIGELIDRHLDPSISPTRARLRAARSSAPTSEPTPPYRWNWITDGTYWTLVVRVRATGQQLRVSYRATVKPSDADGERIAARLYGLRRLDGTR